MWDYNHFCCHLELLARWPNGTALVDKGLQDSAFRDRYAAFPIAILPALGIFRQRRNDIHYEVERMKVLQIVYICCWFRESPATKDFRLRCQCHTKLAYPVYFNEVRALIPSLP